MTETRWQCIEAHLLQLKEEINGRFDQMKMLLNNQNVKEKQKTVVEDRVTPMGGATTIHARSEGVSTGVIRSERFSYQQSHYFSSKEDQVVQASSVENSPKESNSDNLNQLPIVQAERDRMKGISGDDRSFQVTSREASATFIPVSSSIVFQILALDKPPPNISHYCFPQISPEPPPISLVVSIKPLPLSNTHKLFDLMPNSSIIFSNKLIQEVLPHNPYYHSFSMYLPPPRPPSQPPDSFPFYKNPPTSSPYWQELCLFFYQNIIHHHLYGYVSKGIRYKLEKKKDMINESWIYYKQETIFRWEVVAYENTTQYLGQFNTEIYLNCCFTNYVDFIEEHFDYLPPTPLQLEEELRLLGRAQVKCGLVSKLGSLIIVEVEGKLLETLPAYHPETLLTNICSRNGRRAQSAAAHHGSIITNLTFSLEGLTSISADWNLQPHVIMFANQLVVEFLFYVALGCIPGCSQRVGVIELGFYRLNAAMHDLIVIMVLVGAISEEATLGYWTVQKFMM